MTVRITTLQNGLRVVSDTMKQVETVSLGVWVDVGARYEPLQLHGISHLLEHMIFKGTKTRSAAQIAEEIEAVGGYLNAYTSREHTSYYSRVLKEDIALAIEILGDILLNSVFDEEELKREQEVILQEIGQVQDTPDDLVFDNLQATAFPDQSLGRPILGTEESVSSFDRASLQTYMKPNYSAENMVVVAAGNLDHEALVALVEKLFAKTGPNGKQSFEGGVYKGGESRLERDLEQLHLTLGFENCSYHDDNYYAGQVYTTILGGGMSSRLFQEVREKRGFAYSVYAFNAAHADTGLLSIYAGTGPEYVQDLIPIIAGEMKNLSEKTRADELARAKAQLKTGLLTSLESTTQRIEQMGRQMMIFGRIKPVDELVQKVEAVDMNAIQNVALKILESLPTVATIGYMETIPNYEDIQKAFSKS